MRIINNLQPSQRQGYERHQSTREKRRRLKQIAQGRLNIEMENPKDSKDLVWNVGWPSAEDIHL